MNTKNIEILTEDIKEYISIHLEITKLTIIEKTAIVTAGLMSGILIGCVGLLTVIFTSIGVALFLSGYNTSNYIGFALVAGFYLVLFVITLLFRNSLFITPFKTKIIRKLVSMY